VVFPELSLTGYELDAPAVAVDDERLAPLFAACVGAGTLGLAGAVVAADDGGRSIGVLAIDADGIRVAYRKMYLGGDEVDRFVPGRDPAVIDVDGWRLGLAICKDTGIAEHAARTVACGIDVYVAGVLEHDHEADVQPRRALRITNDHAVWVAVASFAGSTGGGYVSAAGGSAVWDPNGQCIAQAGADVNDFAMAVIR
jgi:predicted amidohydrolase